MHPIHPVRYILRVIVLVCAAAGPAYPYRLAETTVVVPSDASLLVRLAGDEIRRYVYLLTSTLPKTASKAPQQAAAIVLRTGQNAAVPQQGPDPSQNYTLCVESNQQIV